jgi:pyruvate,water dikinase
MLDMIPREILVTTGATASLMLAMEKTAGIVTDEGGMLCHAAIVSREFDIPCEIGTDDATRRLRTGDTIDMSAGEGRVKIVSRAQPRSHSLSDG